MPFVADVTVEFYEGASRTIREVLRVTDDYARDELVIEPWIGRTRRYANRDVSGWSATPRRRIPINPLKKDR